MSNQKLEEKKIGSAPKPSIGSELNEPKIERCKIYNHDQL